MKYPQLAKTIPYCCGCRAPNTGTIRLAHRNLNGWGMKFGRGIKSMALTGAFLCAECDARYGESKAIEDGRWWEMAVQRSISWAWDEGYLGMIQPSGKASKEALR